MSSPLYRFTEWWLGQVPLDLRGRRAIDETLADWRSEAAKVAGFGRAFAVSGRAVISIVRSLVLICLREAGSKEGLSSLRRFGVWCAASMLLFVVFNWRWTIPVDGVPVPLGPFALSLASISWTLGLTPLLAFVSMAWASRGATESPRLGPALIAGLMMFGAMGWVMPAANQEWRELVFGMSGGTGALAPGMNERSLVELIRSIQTANFWAVASALNVRLVFTIAVPVMFMLGISSRSLSGWRRVAANAAPLLVFLGTLVVASVVSSGGTAAMWPGLFVAVLVTRALVRSARPDVTNARGMTA